MTALLLGLSPGARAETLAAAVQAALTYHPTAAAAVADSDALAEESREKKSDFYPQVNVSATGGREFADNSTSRGLNTVRGTGYSWLWEGNVTASQLLFDGFETSRRVDAAAARRDSAMFNVMDVREDLALRTVLAYLDVMRATQSVEKLQAHEKIISDYVRRIEKMVKDGGADKSMVEQAKDVRAQLRSSLSNMEGQLKSSIAAYVDLTGHEPDEAMERPVPPADMIAPDAAAASDYAMIHHPMIRAAVMTEAASGMDAAAEQAAWYPDVRAEASYLKRDLDDVIGGEVTDAKAVVRMNWNYAVGGAQQARVRKTMHRREESHAKLEEMKRRVARDIQVAYSDRDTAQEQVDVQRERVDINRGLLKAHKAQFEAAKVNLLQLLQTENALFNADLALMNGEYRVLSSEYSIMASGGRLQEALGIPRAVSNEK
jgi:adhesin transport system outer membrane protein